MENLFLLLRKLRVLLTPLLRSTPIILSFLLFGCLLLLINKNGARVPRWDEWDVYGGLLVGLERGTLSLADFFRYHNEHRMAFTRFVLLLTAPITGWWNLHFVFFVNAAIAFLTWLLYWRQSAKTQKSFGQQPNKWLPLMMALLVFSPLQEHNWTWAHQVGHFSSVFFFSAGFFLLSSPRFSWKKFVGAVLCGLPPTFSLANGLLFWPVAFLPLLTVQCAKKTKTTALVLWGFITVCIWVGYLQDYPTSSDRLFWSMLHPVLLAQYWLAYLGSPIHNVNTLVAIVLGAAGVIFIVGLLLTRIEKSEVRVFMPWLAMMAYTSLTGGVIAVGRVHFGVHQALASKYITLSYPFWVSLLVVLCIMISNDRQDSLFSSRKKTTLYPAFAIIFSLHIIAVAVAIHRWEMKHQALTTARQELPDICPGNYRLIRKLHPRPARVAKLLPYFERYAERHKISIDSQQKSFQDYQIQESDVFAGSVRRIVRNASAQKSHARCIEFTGWAVDPLAGRPAKAVLLVSQGNIIKTGIVGQRRKGAARYLKNENYTSSGWRIFVRQDRLPKHENSYEAYAVMSDGVRLVKLRKHHVPERR